MSINTLFENIHKKFISYETYLTNSNSLGLTNESIFAENHMQFLLNIIFDWNLINANSIKKNQAGYDLVDVNNKIYIQVTADKNHSTKFKNAVGSFKNLNEKIESGTMFLVLFISAKENKKLIANVKEDELNYQAYFIPQLLEKIRFLSEDKLEKIDTLLDQLLAPSILNIRDKAKRINIIPVQSIVEIGSGIYIKREILVEGLYAFTQAGNGLLTGGPGYGKSFILEELQRKYSMEKAPCYIIRINELTKGSDEEIGKLLSSSKKWMAVLKTLHWNTGVKGLLIFDAFDTAKDDSLKLEILNVMRMAIKELTNWNVLTSARTYDASKSNKLQEIFPQEKVGADIRCRNFSIPDLADDELDGALNSKGLKTIADNCAEGLQKLLRVPYFLKLFENILSNNDTIIGINTVETEAQLLEVFWKMKIDDSCIDFLYSLTKKLVGNDSLVCDKLEFVKSDNSHIFNSLVSLNILQEVAMKRNVSFTHNILLEFAISKYILQVDVEKQVKLIENTPKSPFHFRQSFIYFYSQMWSDENTIFWLHYNYIKQINVPLFRLFHHTIFNYVLVYFYKTPDEILINLIDNDEEVYGNAIRRTLESIRFIRKGNLLDQDIDLILEVSKQINVAYLWELGNLIELGIQQSKIEKSHILLKKLSNASCYYLEFVLKERYGSLGWFIDGSGASFGIPNIINSFQFNKIKIKSLLKKVMKILNEKNFPIRYFHSLADNLSTIATIDLVLGLSIYKTLYFFNETSTEETSMGGGATLSLRSNRKQDYDHIHYVLETKYLDFLKIDFDGSLQLGLDIINKFSSGDGYSYNPKPTMIKIGILKSAIKFDSGYYDEEKDHGPVSFLSKIFDNLETLVTEKASNDVIEQKLYLILKSGGASKIWRRLLGFLSNHPKKFLNVSFQVLENTGIYECEETLHEAGELIRSVWPLLSIKQKKMIEDVIHKQTSFEIQYPEFGKRKISRLLSCIPDENFTLDKSVKFVSENGIGENPIIVEDRRPIMAQPYQHTPDERMIYAGFDPEIDDDKPIYSFYHELEIFNSKFENNNNSAQLKREYKSSIPTLDKLFSDSFKESFRNERIKHSCELEISRCARILSGVGRKLNLGEQKKIKSIARFYIDSPDYIQTIYESGDIKNRYGIGGSSARTEAVKIIQNLYFSFKNDDFVDLILSLMSDNDLGVRYRALNSLQLFYDTDREKFWNKVTERVSIENDGVCIQKIAETLNSEYIITNDLIKVHSYCNRLVQKLASDEDIPRDTWNYLVAITLRISLRHNSELALDIINKGISIKQFSHNLIFTIRTVLNEYNGKKSYIEELDKGTILFDILQLQLTFRFEEILRKGIQNPDAKDDFEIIDLIIQNLYFAYDYDNGNKNASNELTLPEKKALYGKIKPLLDYTANQSLNIEQGFMIAHTGYYFMQLLNKLLPLEPNYILKISNIIVVCAAKNNFTFDRITLREIVKLTEGIIADHGVILKEKQNFLYLIEILDQFTTSGFEEAIELTWRLKEAF